MSSTHHLDKYKARLVAIGFCKNLELIFLETFNPVIKTTTMGVVIVLGLFKGWIVRKFYVNNAALHGELFEYVYMVQPSRFDSTDKGLVCRLKKALYGLKQASMAWYWKLSATLVKIGFVKAKSSSLLFSHNNSSSMIY